MNFHALMNTDEYDFLRTNKRLGDRIMLLGLGGSYAYGTSRDGSDIDFRGQCVHVCIELVKSVVDVRRRREAVQIDELVVAACREESRNLRQQPLRERFAAQRENGGLEAVAAAGERLLERVDLFEILL
ncbi:MAG: nucleotidyltransferase domain-containing protein, partial [Lachnospiraceae bacterium]|nr:nucleotidyltransferase domain-containing protein [Lachnospiraceae bacterium]